jgi:N utilization substance protein B
MSEIDGAIFGDDIDDHTRSDSHDFSSNPIEHPHLVSRRMAREIALRANYAIEMRGCSVEEALRDELVTEGVVLPDFTKRLVAYCETYRNRIDDVVRNKIERWEFHRVATIDRLILRQAAAEMLYFPDVPPKVTINEAIEVAKKFSTENSGRFINGVLDSIYGDLGRGINLVTDGDSETTH